MAKDQARDRAERWETILKIAVSALTPILVAVFGFVGTYYLRSYQETSARATLYAQLMSGREKSDSDLRQAMFDVIIKTFLQPDETGKRKLGEQVLALELLAYNFHDAIDIGPLFNYVKSNIDNQLGLIEINCPKEVRPKEPEETLHDKLVDRLHKVAREVSRKQLATIRDGGAIFEIDMDLEALGRRKNDPEVGRTEIAYPADLILFDGKFLDVSNYTPDTSSKHRNNNDYPRRVIIDVTENNDLKRELFVRFELVQEKVPGAKNGEEIKPEIDASFWLGFFDFPMIDNSRLPDGQRIAVVLREYEECSHAKIAIAYFPSSRASLKEKAYIDQIIDDLNVGRDNR